MNEVYQTIEYLRSDSGPILALSLFVLLTSVAVLIYLRKKT
jgi:hypothetical protein